VNSQLLRTSPFQGAESETIPSQPVVAELVGIPTDAEPLRGCLTYPEFGQPTWRALIAGPHPLLGGNLKNNVVRTLRTTLAAFGAVTLAFDYSSETDPEGEPVAWTGAVSDFWIGNHVARERRWIDESRFARQWLRGAGNLPEIVIGYSFGCVAVLEARDGVAPAALVLIAPNPKVHRLERIPQRLSNVLVIRPEDDFACDAETLSAWSDMNLGPHVRKNIPSSQHFFRGRETEIVRAILAFANECGIGKVV
jgi:alpha/beta superfamily hydrolase